MVVDLPRTVVLDDERSLTIREMTSQDLDGLVEMFGMLSLEDLEYRFFTGHAPPRDVIRRWTTTSDRGGFGIVAVLDQQNRDQRLVAEAGYELLSNGDGEFAITVAPDHRGWLGVYVLDILRRAATERGVSNLEADVSCSNRRMIALLRHHGYVILDRDGARTMKVAIPARGRVPTWPGAPDRPRILVEGTSRWTGEDALVKAGYEVIRCPGPERGGPHPCPLLEGGSCPLIEGADAVIVKVGGPSDLGDRLLQVHEEREGREEGSPRVTTTGDLTLSDGSPDEIIARLRGIMGRPEEEPRPVR